MRDKMRDKKDEGVVRRRLFCPAFKQNPNRPVEEEPDSRHFQKCRESPPERFITDLELL
jgi:hypothetical protein